MILSPGIKSCTTEHVAGWNVVTRNANNQEPVKQQDQLIPGPESKRGWAQTWKNERGRSRVPSGFRSRRRHPQQPGGPTRQSCRTSRRAPNPSIPNPHGKTPPARRHAPASADLPAPRPSPSAAPLFVCSGGRRRRPPARPRRSRSLSGWLDRWGTARGRRRSGARPGARPPRTTPRSSRATRPPSTRSSPPCKSRLPLGRSPILSPNRFSCESSCCVVFRISTVRLPRCACEFNLIRDGVWLADLRNFQLLVAVDIAEWCLFVVLLAVPFSGESSWIAYC